LFPALGRITKNLSFILTKTQKTKQQRESFKKSPTEGGKKAFLRSKEASPKKSLVK